MYFISIALSHLVVIFRSVKSTSKFRNPFFRRQESSHTLGGRFKGTARVFQFQESLLFLDGSFRAVRCRPLQDV